MSKYCCGLFSQLNTRFRSVGVTTSQAKQTCHKGACSSDHSRLSAHQQLARCSKVQVVRSHSLDTLTVVARRRWPWGGGLPPPTGKCLSHGLPYVANISVVAVKPGATRPHCRLTLPEALPIHEKHYTAL